MECIKVGNQCYYASEFLCRIHPKEFFFELETPLIEYLSYMIKKTDQIAECRRPLLFIVLTAQFLKHLAYYSNLNKLRLNYMIDHLLDYGHETIKALKNENDISFYLLQQSIDGSTCLEIIARNRFLVLLEDHEVRIIVFKMWAGNSVSKKLYNASTLYNSLIAPPMPPDSLEFTKWPDFS
jgi:hypothetical protein